MKNIKGQIIFIDDEIYEKELFKISLHTMGWNVHLEYFSDPEEALEYLKHTKKDIFLIVSDMSMPKMSGLDLKRAIDNDNHLRKKAIPFIFASNAATKKEVSEAYDYRVQGYFKKPADLNETAEMLDTILKYWSSCRHPNNVK